MGYEGLTKTLKEGFMAWMVLIAAMVAWLFGGSFRNTLAAGGEWIWPRSEADVLDEETDRIEADAESLMASLAPEPEVTVARRFLAGEMTADISVLGAATSKWLVAMKVQGIDPTMWTDRRLLDTMYGKRPKELDRRVLQRIADDLDWSNETGFAV